MDPLSLAASIAGIIALADVVITKGYQYFGKVKEAKNDWRNLATEVATLRAVLTALQSNVNNVDPNQQTFLSVSGLITPDPTSKFPLIESTRSLLDKVIKVIKGWEDAPSHKKLLWPFKSSEAKDYLDNISRHKASFELALAVDNFSGIQTILESECRIESKVDQIALEQQRVRDEKEARRKEELLRKIFKWLSPIDPRTHYENARGLHSPGTGQWLLDTPIFESFWDRQCRFVWLSGGAGTGKTILSSTIIKELSERVDGSAESYALGYVFCNFQDASSIDILNILGSFVKQLLIKLPKTSNYSLEEIYKQHMTQGSQDPRKPNFDCLFNIIVDLAGELDHVYLYIDALDEYPFDERDTLLECLRDLERRSPHLSLFVASRPEYDIKIALEGVKELFADSPKSRDDMTSFVKAEIRKKPRLMKISDINDLAQTLVGSADGMFRWVKCQLDVLGKARSRNDVRKALSNLPKGLYETYDRILESIEDEADKKRVQRSLHCLIFTMESFTLQTLVDITAIELDHDTLEEAYEERLGVPEDLLQICSSLVSIDQDGETVKIAHFSVKEYLESIHCKNRFPEYAIEDAKSSHQQIADACLTYLAFDDLEPTVSALSSDFFTEQKSLWFYADEQAFNHFCLGNEIYVDRKWFRKLFFNWDFSAQYLGWQTGYLHEEYKRLDYTWLFITRSVPSLLRLYFKDERTGSNPRFWDSIPECLIRLPYTLRAEASDRRSVECAEALFEGLANMDPERYLAIDKAKLDRFKYVLWWRLSGMNYWRIPELRDIHLQLRQRYLEGTLKIYFWPLAGVLPSGNMDAIRYLLEKTPDINGFFLQCAWLRFLEGRLGTSAFQAVTEPTNFQCLLDFGLDISLVEAGRSILVGYPIFISLDTIRKALDAGADPNGPRDQDEKLAVTCTPLEYARTRYVNRPDIASLLIERGAIEQTELDGVDIDQLLEQSWGTLPSQEG